MLIEEVERLFFDRYDEGALDRTKFGVKVRFRNGGRVYTYNGTPAITIKTFDGRSVSWVGCRFIRLPSEEQVISRIAEGSPLAESVGH